MGDMSIKKQQTRKRMIDAASRNFRSKGYAGIGVDGIAKAAGVTSGAFYSHFGSKDAAFSAALDAGLDEVIATVPVLQQEHGKAWVQAFSDYYIGKAHRNNLEGGCAMATLSPEVVRASPKTHTAYETKMVKITELLAKGLAGGSTEDRQSRAWALLGVLIGGLTMARAVKTRKTTEIIAASIQSTAVGIAGATRLVAGASR